VEQHLHGSVHRQCSEQHQTISVAAAAAATSTTSCRSLKQPPDQLSPDYTGPTYTVTKLLVITTTVEPGLPLLCMSVFVVLVTIQPSDTIIDGN